MAIPFRRIVTYLSFVIVIAFVSGCGGGGGSSEAGGSEVFPSKILTWNPPSQYTDGTSLNPVRDLDRFEIYVNENGSFSNADSEMAAISAVDPRTGQPATAFDLANIGPFISKGVTYYVSIRTVALNGMKSNFSPSAAFSF